MMHSSIRTAYARVQSAVAELAWPHAELRTASCWMDLMLEEVRDLERTALDEDRRFLVHDTFGHVLALARTLHGSDRPELAPLCSAVDALVDAFAPMVAPGG